MPPDRSTVVPATPSRATRPHTCHSADNSPSLERIAIGPRHVTKWSRIMAPMDIDEDLDGAFKALADPTRRFLLDLLFARDGRTLTELESELEMTRFGVMKHLKVLEEAGLVVSRK